MRVISYSAGLLASLVLCLGLLSCGPKEVEMPEAPEGLTLFEAWKQVTGNDPNTADFVAASQLAGRMANEGPDGLDPLIGVLEDPTAGDGRKVAATISMTPYMHLARDIVPRLKALTDAEHDTTTRACATQLLGEFVADEATDHVRGLLDDEAFRVRFTAGYILMKYGDETALAKLGEFWESPELNTQQKTSLVTVIPPEVAHDHFAILAEAAADFELDSSARTHAVELLGQMDTPEALAPLEKSAAEDPSASVRELAGAALEAVRARIEGGADGEAVPAPSEESAQPVSVEGQPVPGESALAPAEPPAPEQAISEESAPAPAEAPAEGQPAPAEQ